MDAFTNKELLELWECIDRDIHDNGGAGLIERIKEKIEEECRRRDID